MAGAWPGAAALSWLELEGRRSGGGRGSLWWHHHRQHVAILHLQAADSKGRVGFSISNCSGSRRVP